MSVEEEHTPLEAEIGRRLSASVRGNHLQTADLVELAVQGAASSRYEAGMDHLVTCTACRSLLRQFQELERVRLDASTARPARLSGVSGRRTLIVSLAAAAALLLIIGRFVLAPARPIASLQDAGGTVRLTAGEALEGLPPLEPAQQQLIMAALRTGRLPVPAVLDALRPTAGSGYAAPAFAVTGPIATVISATQPEFTWKMPAGAVTCRILVENLADPQQAIKSKPLRDEHWKPKKPLKPGQSYRWQVIALDRNGKEIAEVPQTLGTARFKVLETERAAALEQAQAKLGRSHLAMGVLYTQEGMLDAAEQEFQALSRTNANSDLVRRLLESVRSLRG